MSCHLPKAKYIGKYLRCYLPRFDTPPYKDIENLDTSPYKDIENLDIYLLLDEKFEDRIVFYEEEINSDKFILYVGKNVLIKMRNQKINEILK